ARCNDVEARLVDVTLDVLVAGSALARPQGHARVPESELKINLLQTRQAECVPRTRDPDARWDRLPCEAICGIPLRLSLDELTRVHALHDQSNRAARVGGRVG